MTCSVLTTQFYFIGLVALLLALIVLVAVILVWMVVVMTLWLWLGPTRLIRWLILRQRHSAKEAS